MGMAKGIRLTSVSDETHRHAMANLKAIRKYAQSYVRMGGWRRPWDHLSIPCPILGVEFDDLFQDAYLYGLTTSQDVLSGAIPGNRYLAVLGNRLRVRLGVRGFQWRKGMDVPRREIEKLWIARRAQASGGPLTSDQKESIRKANATIYDSYEYEKRAMDKGRLSGLDCGCDLDDEFGGFESVDLADFLEVALGRIPHFSAEVIRDRIGFGRPVLTAREVAERDGVSDSAVNERLRKAVAKLRVEIQKMEADS